MVTLEQMKSEAKGILLINQNPSKIHCIDYHFGRVLVVQETSSREGQASELIKHIGDAKNYSIYNFTDKFIKDNKTPKINSTKKGASDKVRDEMVNLDKLMSNHNYHDNCNITDARIGTHNISGFPTKEEIERARHVIAEYLPNETPNETVHITVLGYVDKDSYLLEKKGPTNYRIIEASCKAKPGIEPVRELERDEVRRFLEFANFGKKVEIKFLDDVVIRDLEKKSKK